MLAKVLFISVILPPLEIYCLFQSASLLLTLSSTPSHIEGALLAYDPKFLTFQITENFPGFAPVVGFP